MHLDRLYFFLGHYDINHNELFTLSHRKTLSLVGHNHINQESIFTSASYLIVNAQIKL